MANEKIYLALAIIGAVVPYVFLIQHFGAAGFGPVEFIEALFLNSAAGGGEPKEVARAILWLLSADAGNTVGSVIDVTGGV